MSATAITLRNAPIPRIAHALSMLLKDDVNVDIIVLSHPRLIDLVGVRILANSVCLDGVRYWYPEELYARAEVQCASRKKEEVYRFSSV